MKYETATFMHTVIYNQLPLNFNMYFKQNEQVRDHDTRRRSNIFITDLQCALLFVTLLESTDLVCGTPLNQPSNYVQV